MRRRGVLKSGLLLAGAAAFGSLAMMYGFARSGRRAPAFTGLQSWINTSNPITIAELSGKVVLVSFWTYSCINCRRTIPYLKRWQTEYGPSGSQIIGIHTPEFRFEHVRPNVEAYVCAERIPYPVAQDNNFRTWDAWENDAWPGVHLLDRDRRIVLSCEGEDHAHEMEVAIRGLLGLSSTGKVESPSDDPDLARIGSPEMYFGTQHPTPQDSRQSPQPGDADYSFAVGRPSTEPVSVGR